MATKGSVTFSSFKGGDSGRMRPTPDDLSRYRGINTWVYPNGALGPRPPWWPVAITGLPATKTLRTFDASRGPTGTWYAWGFSDGTVYSTTGGSLAAALRGTTANEAGTVTGRDIRASHVLPNTVSFVTDTDNTGARIRYNGNWEPLYALPAGDAIGGMGEQTVVLVNPDPSIAANASTPYLRFSAPRDPTDWPAENSVFIGSTGFAHGIYLQKDFLVIPRAKVGDIFVFTGVLGFNETLRLVDRGVAPPDQNRAKGAVISSSLLVYTSGRTISVFTGAQLLQQHRPDIPEIADYDTNPEYDNPGNVVGLDDDERFIIVGTVDQTADVSYKRIWAQSYSPEQGWHRHIIPVTPFRASQAATCESSSRDTAKAAQVSPVGASGLVALCTVSDATYGNTPRVFQTYLRQESPYLPPGKTLSQGVSVTSVADADSGLPVVASWTSAEVWGEDGTELTVRSVLVDYSFDTDARIQTSLGGGVVPNRFDISVQAIQNAESTTTVESTAVPFVPAVALGTAIDGGTVRRGRKLFQFGSQGPGGGFRIKLADWRGIMIHRITVEYDISPART